MVGAAAAADVGLRGGLRRRGRFRGCGGARSGPRRGADGLRSDVGPVGDRVAVGRAVVVVYLERRVDVDLLLAAVVLDRVFNVLLRVGNEVGATDTLEGRQESETRDAGQMSGDMGCTRRGKHTDIRSHPSFLSTLSLPFSNARRAQERRFP